MAESAGYYFLDMTQKQAEKMYNFYIGEGYKVDEKNRVVIGNSIAFKPFGW